MKLKLFTLAICVFAGSSLYAQNRTKEAGFQSDNDSFLGQGSDRYYTNGFFLYYRQALDVKSDSKLANKILGFELGQKLFNAQSGRLPSAQYIDRPVAGYLYAASTLNMLYKNESNLKLSAAIGIVGRASGGEQIQNFIHDTFGFYELNTWQYQVRNDVQLNLSAEYNRLLGRTSFGDISFASYGNLGTGFTGAGLGPMIRLGNFNQLFQSVSTQSTAGKTDEGSLLHKHEFFLYYKPQVNFVAYDATVQGSLFKDHPEAGTMEITGDIKPVVLSQKVGVGITTSRFVFDVGAVFDTKEVKSMARKHQWGTLTALYRFN
ncbi:lipid A deacylase LpxR family protein [Mucilaginibacter pallidiroseus]|uniref:Lipid A deacylase LpxR family protein n=1 Tax=Mucilaginibacter pallidiroseus TaxID=2599295 RepID=A0A563U7V1_9SPHI|nr:lipid A deacylase LpxR family protein [Mucilaginibacter pallidiroseus]TWR27452.1 lipid A deacylase LpxR family protein [Mucilaginibacter pallidiroseus]